MSTADRAEQAFEIHVIPQEGGGYRAEFPGGAATATSLGELMDAIKDALVRREASPGGAPGVAESGEDEDAGFEEDLDYTLTKNAELYRRLAR